MITVTPAHSFTYDGAQINVFHANKKQGLPKHNHLYSHAIVCNFGRCLVSLEGRNYMIDKNSKPLNLPANEWHEIEALEDMTVFTTVFAEDKY